MSYQETDAYGKIWVTQLTANDSTPKETLGAIRELADGRRFRYTRMTGSACALGQVLMPATTVTVTDASSANGVGPDGATTTIVTDADAAWTADDYIGWYFQVATSMTGSTEPLRVVGNTKTTLTLEKSISDIMTTSATATDDGQIHAGPAASILQAAGDLDVATNGVCIGTLTEDYYGWVQVAGYAAVLSHALTEGATVSGGGAAAGEGLDAAAADDNVIGVCVATSGNDEYSMVDLRIA